MCVDEEQQSTKCVQAVIGGSRNGDGRQQGTRFEAGSPCDRGFRRRTANAMGRCSVLERLQVLRAVLSRVRAECARWRPSYDVECG